MHMIVLGSVVQSDIQGVIEQGQVNVVMLRLCKTLVLC